jgi:hypothetical protein
MEVSGQLHAPAALYSGKQPPFTHWIGESATHILCYCEAVDDVRFRHLGQFLIETSDYHDALIYKVLNFIRGVGLIEG